MLSSLRRDASNVEEYQCQTCGRPLLDKNSVCPVCSKNQATLPSLRQNTALPLESSHSPMMKGLKPVSAIGIGNQTLILSKLMNIIGMAGMVLALFLMTGPDLRFALFQGFMALGMSLILVAASVLLQKQQGSQPLD